MCQILWKQSSDCQSCQILNKNTSSISFFKYVHHLFSLQTWTNAFSLPARNYTAVFIHNVIQWSHGPLNINKKCNLWFSCSVWLLLFYFCHTLTLWHIWLRKRHAQMIYSFVNAWYTVYVRSWPPYRIGQAIIFSSCGFFLLLFFLA